MDRRHNLMMRRHRAELAGKLARRLGLELRHNPHRGRTGFGRELWEAWRDGWKEQDREAALAELIRKRFNREG